MPELAAPLLIVFVLAFPITYLAHRGLARFIYSSNTPESSITDVIGEHFGALAESIYRHLFLRRLYHSDYVCGGYHQHRAELYHPPVGNGRASRSLVAIVLILGLMFIVRFGQRLIMRVMSTLVYPFIISLIFMALF